MSGHAMPNQANGVSHLDRNTANMPFQELVPAKSQPQSHNEQNGPLKELIAHQDSLYKYISWEDPTRTIGSFIVAQSILFGTHYLPLTQWGLKAAATVLGAVSVTEFASRSFGPNTIFSNLRPKEYKTVPEPILNATLKDIHDFTQFAIVKAQKIIFGQDLYQTFISFIGFIAVYWLIKVVSPFWLAVLALNSLYMIPIIWSPRGREIAQDVKVRAGELTNAAATNGKNLANTAIANGKAMADNATTNGANLAQDGKNKVAELSSKVRGNGVVDATPSGEASQSGKYATNDLSTRSDGLVSKTNVLPSALDNQQSNNIGSETVVPPPNVNQLPEIVQDSYRQAQV